MNKRSLVIALTGASGIVYALGLLRRIDLAREKYSDIYVVYTANSEKVAFYEEGVDLSKFLSDIRGLSGVYRDDDLLSPLASSSNLVSTDMVIVPASMNTVAKIANGIQDNLVTRAASAVLRLGNKLVIVFRETPLSAIDLFNLYRLALNRALILPAAPGFYGRPRDISGLVDFMVGKILDVLGVKHSLYKRWSSSPTSS